MTNKFPFLVSFLALIGRICFSLMFVIAGFNKIINFTETAQMMAGAGVPNTELFLVIAIIFELGGGLLILLGWYTRFGAFLIFLFLIPVTFMFHAFWIETDQTAMMNNMYHFFKNLTIFGASIYLMAFGGGHFSIDGFVRKKA